MEAQTVINKELVALCLKNKYRASDVNVMEFSYEPAVPNGTNFISDLYRVRVVFTRRSSQPESQFLILKIESLNEELQSFTAELDTFNNEFQMYCEVLPAITNASATRHQFAPTCYHASKAPRLIALKDYWPLGYKIIPHTEGLDLKQCKLVMERIAQFHAASMIVAENNPDIITEYKRGIFTANTTDWMEANCATLIDCCKKWNGMEKYVEKFARAKEDYVNLAMNCVKVDKDGINVLNHGDFWGNNILIQSDDQGNPIDLKMVDFQMVRYGSPAIDLHYFLTISPKLDVHKNHLDELLDIYYNNFVAALKSVNSLKEVPTREEFLKEYKKRAFYGFITISGPIPLQKASSSGYHASFENFVKNIGGYRDHCFNNSYFREFMEYIVPYYDNLGFLD